jgi:hypothetical protein
MALPDPVTFQAYLTIIMSVVAIAPSSITLGWTIYMDVTTKPKFKKSVAIKTEWIALADSTKPNVSRLIGSRRIVRVTPTS